LKKAAAGSRNIEILINQVTEGELPCENPEKPEHASTAKGRGRGVYKTETEDKFNTQV